MRKVPRVLGLIIASFIAAAYLLIVVGSLFDNEPFTFNIEALGIFVLTLLTVASTVVAWIRVRTGVWMVLAVGVLFAIFGVVTAGHNRWMAVLAAGGPLILGGLLTLWGLRLERED